MKYNKKYSKSKKNAKRILICNSKTKYWVRYRMPTKDWIKSRVYAVKSPQELINSNAFDEYRKRNAEAETEYRKKLKGLKHNDIRDKWVKFWCVWT